jgi:hypothetical protein
VARSTRRRSTGKSSFLARATVKHLCLVDAAAAATAAGRFALGASTPDLGTEARRFSPYCVRRGRERGSCIGYMSSPRNEDEVHAISSSIPEGEAFGLQAWNGHGSTGRWQWTLCGVCLSTMGPRCLCSSLWICGPSLYPAEAPRIRHYQQRNSKDKHAYCTSSRCQFKGIKRQHAMLIAIATAVLVFSQSNSLSERGPLTGKGLQESGTTSNVHLGCLKWSSKASITCLHSQPFQLTSHLTFIL